MSLELLYNIEPDGFGVFDGRELTRELIKDAYLLLLPYVKNCPCCADNLFSVIANEAIFEVQKETKPNGALEGLVLSHAKDEKHRKEAIKKHTDSTQDKTMDLLARLNRWSETKNQEVKEEP